MEILVYKEGSEDLNMCKLALMVIFGNFNDLTNNNNLETILNIQGWSCHGKIKSSTVLIPEMDL